TRADRLRRRVHRRRDDHPGRLGSTRAHGRDAVLAGAHVRADRSLPAGEPGARCGQRSARRLRHDPGCRHPAGTHLRTTGSGKDHRPVNELDAAGITEPALRAAYAGCRRINAHYGRTFFLATRLLPARARPAAHTLYGFARMADELVDNPSPGSDPATELGRVAAMVDVVFDGGTPDDPVLVALSDTVRRYG